MHLGTSFAHVQDTQTPKQRIGRTTTRLPCSCNSWMQYGNSCATSRAHSSSTSAISWHYWTKSTTSEAGPSCTIARRLEWFVVLCQTERVLDSSSSPFFLLQGSKTVIRCTSAWTLLEAHPQAADFRNPFYMVPLRGEASSDRSPTVLQFKWHTSSLAIWTAFYLRSLESNDSRVYQVPFPPLCYACRRALVLPFYLEQPILSNSYLFAPLRTRGRRSCKSLNASSKTNSAPLTSNCNVKWSRTRTSIASWRGYAARAPSCTDYSRANCTATR